MSPTGWSFLKMHLDPSCERMPKGAAASLLSCQDHWTWAEVIGVLDLPPAPLHNSLSLAPLHQLAKDELWAEFEDLEDAWRDEVCLVRSGWEPLALSWIIVDRWEKTV